MKHFYPDFYKKFNCIAAECPDSCCKDWDVVVDDDSQAFYSGVTGAFGEKLKNFTAVDSDGDRIFVSQNGKCPFWNSQKLCDIYTTLGEEHLCATCKGFPRITQDYTAFSEHMLSFACPEAARLMLGENENFSYETSVSPEESVDYDINMMNFLLTARKITLDIFNNSALTFAQMLKQSLVFNAKIQDILDEEDYSISKIPEPFEIFQANAMPVSTHKTDCSFIFDLHKQLDIMSKKWRDFLDKTATRSHHNKIADCFDSQFIILAKYYVFRYYLTAIDSYNVLSTIKRIMCAYIINGHMLSENENLPPQQQTLIIQRYSKEVEHSYENSELLEDEFLFNPDFSTENLLNIIESN